MIRQIAFFIIALAITACGSSPTAAPTAIPASPTRISDFILTPHPTSTAYKSPTPAPDVILTARSAVNIRSGPGTGYQILDVLRVGDSAQVVGQNSGWWNIQTDAITGWVINDPRLIDIQGDASEIVEVDAPPTAAFISAPKPTSIPAQANDQPQPTVPPAKPGPTSAPPAGVTCPGFQYTCDQLTCAQAYACLKAGNQQLDRNKDGIPCNSKCA